MQDERHFTAAHVINPKAYWAARNWPHNRAQPLWSVRDPMPRK
jgi:hypothetical protein